MCPCRARDAPGHTTVIMISAPKIPRIVTAALVLLIVFVSSYCTQPEEQNENLQLSPDETYLVETYVRLAQAQERHFASSLEAESLFAVLDSTVDTVRVANAIHALDKDPDRWLEVFRAIERALRTSSQGADLEETRGRPGATGQVE